VKMFTEGGVEEGEEDGTKEQSSYETPDFHVVIALHPVIDSEKGTHDIYLLLPPPFFYYFILIFYF
jgi:hypothetical protein